MTSIFLVAVLLAIYALKAAAWIILVKLGASWAKLPATWSRIVRLSVIVFTAYCIVWVAVLLSLESDLPVQMAAVALWLGLEIAIPLLLFRKSFKTTITKSLQLWLPTLLSTLVVFPVVSLTQRYVAESFVVPTNPMAPTIIGTPLLGECPECGATNYHRKIPFEAGRPIGDVYAICDNFHSTASDITIEEAVEGGRDRVFVNKLLKPERWDIIAFRTPSRPSQKMIFRLVGLPGETIQIKEGGFWVNGKRLEPPAAIQGLTYTDHLHHQRAAGAERLTLDDDELFVLGDNTWNSWDSRFWTSSAKGYLPFALPEHHVEGVVTHVYRPRNRMRKLR